MQKKRVQIGNKILNSAYSKNEFSLIFLSFR